MEFYNYKKCLDGVWNLYIEENNNCKDYCESMHCESDLKKMGIKPIPGTVPGNFELDMQKAGLIGDLYFDTQVLEAQKLENRHLWYVTSFNFDGEFGEDMYLRFEGVDTLADYYLNGEYIGSTDNMLIANEIYTDNIAVGENELMLHIFPVVIESRNEKFGAGVTSAMRYNFGSLEIRKSPSMYGWDIMPRIVSGGIWKSVYLCHKKTERINNTYMYAQDHGKPLSQVLYYDVDIDGDYSTEYSIDIYGECGDSTFSQSQKLWHTEGMFGVKIENPKLWWPRNMGEQNLYTVTVKLMHGDTVCDTKTFRHGLRYVELIKSDYIDENGKGDFKFVVNGNDFFIMGTNWVPLDAFHSRDKERMPKALELLGESGCNMIRCWGGNTYENEELYDFCDEHGIAIWQDFVMGCAIYPQHKDFCDKIEYETEQVVEKYRQHPALFLWAGDNETDIFVVPHRNPNDYIITREILPRVIERTDPTRSYLPSSPYISQKAYAENMIDNIPENHLWGPRQYYKQEFYSNSVCRFASETGYHGCNSPESIKKFIAKDKLWPWQDNASWIVHAASMEPEIDSPYAYRIKLMASHLKVLFGETVPDGLESFALASQISQSEACKYFIERFRTGKGERTGIIWWNLLDGWPQFSDAVIDYYYCRKLAYFVIERSQKAVCLMFRDPSQKQGVLELCAANETLVEKSFSYKISDIESGKIITEGNGTVKPNSTDTVVAIKNPNGQNMLLIEYEVDGKKLKNHYLCGAPTYDYNKIVSLYKKAGLLNIEGF